MARLEFRPRDKKVYQGVYNVAWPINRVEEYRSPDELLQERLNEFIGEPNTEVTRMRIQHVLDTYNFIYHENVSMEDLTMF